jgi:hypothetical protein
MEGSYQRALSMINSEIHLVHGCKSVEADAPLPWYRGWRVLTLSDKTGFIDTSFPH